MKLARSLLALALTLSLLPAPLARAESFTPELASKRMLTLGVLRGDPGSMIDASVTITRAELIVLLVRAFGKADDAELLTGAPVFADTADHWASGYIAEASKLVAAAGASLGMPGGRFEPSSRVTRAQAVAFLAKFLGVRPDAAKAWPANYLDAALAQGLITADEHALASREPEQPVTRAELFVIYDRAFYTFDIGSGRTVYTKYSDSEAPTLTLEAVEPPGADRLLTVRGRATGAITLTANGEPVPIAADGSFVYRNTLPEGTSGWNIDFAARDLAGNTTWQSVSKMRTP